jgi:hypothetical protein
MLVAGGCSIASRGKGTRPTEPGSRAVIEPLDSLASFTVGPPDSLAQPAGASNSIPQRTGQKRKGVEPVRPSTPEEAPPQTTEGTAEPPSVSVALPEGERMQLYTAAVGDIAQTEGVLGALEIKNLTEKERQTVDAITGLLTQARAALQQDDNQAAADLARKARLLAEPFRRPTSH